MYLQNILYTSIYAVQFYKYMHKKIKKKKTKLFFDMKDLDLMIIKLKHE